jgi:hypothetical protein
MEGISNSPTREDGLLGKTAASARGLPPPMAVALGEADTGAGGPLFCYSWIPVVLS